MDCQAFVERCMADCGLSMNLGGSNSWYREMTWTGTPEECLRVFGCIPAGALLFILEPPSASTPARFRGDGVGDASHMGIRTGRGLGAIHSSQSRGCVCESDFRNRTVPNGGWNRVGLYRRFSYGEAVDRRLNGEMPETEASDAPAPEAAEAPAEPQAEYARVFAASGKTVNLRKGPGLYYGLTERVPVGTVVRLLKRVDDAWARIAYTDARKAVWYGFMQSRFLQPLKQTPAGCTYTVHVPCLTEDKARALIRDYPGAFMSSESAVT